jgi:hypothetical protein
MSPGGKQFLDSGSQLYGGDTGLSGKSQQQQQSSSHLKATSYTADSLSRCPFCQSSILFDYIWPKSFFDNCFACTVMDCCSFIRILQLILIIME